MGSMHIMENLFKVLVLMLLLWSVMIHGKPLEIEDPNEGEENHSLHCHCMLSTEKHANHIMKDDDENNIDVHIHKHGDTYSPHEHKSHAEEEHGKKDGKHIEDAAEVHCACHHSHNSTENDNNDNFMGLFNHRPHQNRE